MSIAGGGATAEVPVRRLTRIGGNFIGWSPDGRTLASASSDRTVILWDVAGRKALATLEGHKDAVWLVAFSPDGSYIVSAGNGDKTARLWNADTGEEIRVFNGHESGLYDIKFSPDGRQFVSASQ